MSYFRMCVLFCQEENQQIQALQNHPLVIAIRRIIVETKTYRTGSVNFPALPDPHPIIPQFVHFQIGRCA